MKTYNLETPSNFGKKDMKFLFNCFWVKGKKIGCWYDWPSLPIGDKIIPSLLAVKLDNVFSVVSKKKKFRDFSWMFDSKCSIRFSKIMPCNYYQKSRLVWLPKINDYRILFIGKHFCGTRKILHRQKVSGGSNLFLREN